MATLNAGQVAWLDPASRTVVTHHCPQGMRKRNVWSIESFHLLRKIGSGYASTVYLATCRYTGNQVAVKLYHKNKLSELNHFQVAREVRIHSVLDHKHIIQLWASFEDSYGIYLVFEYASKGDVFTEVERRGGQLTEAETVRQVIFPFLTALDYLHSNAIIHRDIKPENLLFTAAGVLKVGDFGLSINHGEERPVTRVGTLDYMAPEVVVCPDKHKPSDHKEMTHLQYTPLVDAWAVGVLAYELTVGRPPFDKGNKKATISEILNGDPQLPPWLSEGAAHFIRWALVKDQAKRPSVQQLAQHPWVMAHMKVSATAVRRTIAKTDSFVETRSAGSSTNETPNGQLMYLQSLQHNRLLGHSNSMTAIDSMRFRDFNAVGSSTDGAIVAAALAAANKRNSDGGEVGTPGGSARPSLAAGHTTSPSAVLMAAQQSLQRQMSNSKLMQSQGSAGQEVLDALVSTLQSAVAMGNGANVLKRSMSREQVLAQLLAPLPQAGGLGSGMHSPQSRQASRPASPLNRSFSARTPNSVNAQPVAPTPPDGPPSPSSVSLSKSRSFVMSSSRMGPGGNVLPANATPAALEALQAELGKLRTNSDSTTLRLAPPQSPTSTSSNVSPTQQKSFRPLPPMGVPSGSMPNRSTPLVPSRLSHSFTSTSAPQYGAVGSPKGSGSAESPRFSRLGSANSAGEIPVPNGFDAFASLPPNIAAAVAAGSTASSRGGSFSMQLQHEPIPEGHNEGLASPNSSVGKAASHMGEPEAMDVDGDEVVHGTTTAGNKLLKSAKGLVSNLKRVFS